MIDHGFDLESTGPAPTAPPPPPNRRGRWRPGGAPSEQPAPAEKAHGRLWQVLCDGRLFYALSAVLSAGALFISFNPDFGVLRRAWFWDVLRTDAGRNVEGMLPVQWTPDFATAVVLLGLTLGYLTTALIGRTRGRGRFALIWVGVAFVAFAASRSYLPYALVGVSIGGLLFAGHGGRSGVRLVLVTTLITAGYLFLPLPLESQDLPYTGTAAPGAYRSIAMGVIEGHTAAAQPHEPYASGEEPGRLARSVSWVRAWLPQHALLIVFALGLLWLMGLRGSWASLAAASVGLLLLGFALWIGAQAGSEAETLRDAGRADGWASLANLGPLLTGQFLGSVLALAAAMGDLAARE